MANAAAFQVLAAVVPFALFCAGLLGFLGLSEIWDRDVAPKLQEDVSIPAYQVIDSAVRQALEQRHVLWATAGLALALWQLSRSIRTASKALDSLNGRAHQRSGRERLGVSLLLAAAVAACLVGAAASAALAPLAYGDVGPVLGAMLWLVRYALAAALLLLAVWLVVRFGPAEAEPAGWVTLGAVLVCVCWLAVTAGFGFYLKAVASYGSIFGALVSVVVLLGWVYLSTLAFMAGIATDAALRDATPTRTSRSGSRRGSARARRGRSRRR